VTRYVVTTSTGSREPLRQLLALLLFLIITIPVAMPCLCPEGAIRGRITSAFAFLVFCRLAWHVYKRTFKFKDYFAYLGIVMAFCVWAETKV
jgi:hypothetical protein